MFKHFCAAKERYDPENLLGSLWWDRYALKESVSPPLPKEISSSVQVADVSPLRKMTAVHAAPFGIRRNDSFRKLLADPNLREQFMNGFLIDIFNIIPQQEMHRYNRRQRRIRDAEMCIHK